MTDSQDSSESQQTTPVKSALTKVLPTNRVSFEKQMSVLRAYAAASGPSKKAVSNDEVAAIVGDLKSSSVSLCNPFLSDAGLLVAEGRKQRPSDAVFEYQHSYEWNAEEAASKLFPVLSETWAAKALVPKLSFRRLSKDEAIQFLASESKATKNHTRHLETLLDYLNAAGVLKVDGDSVQKAAPPSFGGSPGAGEKGNQGKPSDAKKEEHKHPGGSGLDMQPRDEDQERFSIPIPGKSPATIIVPKGLDAEDWAMLSLMIGTYIKRLRKESISLSDKDVNAGGPS